MPDFDLIVVAQPAALVSFDIVFVHGLGGDPKETWQGSNNTKFWPIWLAEAFPRARVLLLQYPTSQLGTLFGGTAVSFVTAAAGASDALRSNGVGTRPTVFITHSLGGIVTKAFLRSCQQSTELSLKNIYEQTTGLVFFGTPNTGSSFASVAGKFPQIASMQTMEIGRADAVLLELSTWYKGNAPKNTRAFYEMLPMGLAVVVDPGSANPGISGCDPVPIARDHVSMCKFEERDEAPYKSILSFIGDECGLAKHIFLEPDDLDYYLNSIEGERRTLDEKLIDGGRQADVAFAKREKERIAKGIRRNILFNSAKSQYKQVLGEINSRFRLSVTPLIETGASKAEVNKAISDGVISPVVDRAAPGSPISTYDDVHAAIYYLTGNCHIDWSVK